MKGKGRSKSTALGEKQQQKSGGLAQKSALKSKKKIQNEEGAVEEQKQQEVQEEQQIQSKLQSSQQFKPKSSVIQSFQKSVQRENKQQQDQISFENVLTEQKRVSRSQDAVQKPKKKFKVNFKEKSTINSQKLKTAEEKMKNPQLLSKKQSSEIEQNELDFTDLQKKQFDLQPNKKGPYKRQSQFNTIITNKMNYEENENIPQSDEEQEQGGLIIDNTDQRMEEYFQEKYGTLFEPNVIPFRKPAQINKNIHQQQQAEKDNKQDIQLKEQVSDQQQNEKQEENFFDALDNEEFVLMQFPTKFLYKLPAHFEKRNKIQRVNRDNFGENSEILNLDVQRRYDSAGNKILQYYGDIDHYVDNWQELKKGKVGFSLGKIVLEQEEEETDTENIDGGNNEQDSKMELEEKDDNNQNIQKKQVCKFISGQQSLQIERGISTNCQQELSMIDQADNTYFKIANVNSKFVVMPNIDDLYGISNPEN